VDTRPGSNRRAKTPAIDDALTEIMVLTVITETTATTTEISATTTVDTETGTETHHSCDKRIKADSTADTRKACETLAILEAELAEY